ncbi:GNAT family N-acetyltransferase [Streptacidiphilus fuscans]|uniref:GNAT family N-acetyltransferase n=1 Tax=Streptacidiphilus fuscans TaxID=2789292 RepID=A0A931FFL3_9ACTN|nr:GNAT family N-acetyltransferase [Streptacidiphilus fuscans]MBF9072166.1 GNAT family N-acetyltransferase [Streptacidiphilus fuscans]MBF9072977.1 GNAT family N-acetyltransferase [Streptacidiphilus fuscans]
MALRFTLDPEVTPELVEGLIDVWTAATNAGGAIGFVAPVTREEVRPTAEKGLAGLGHGPGDGRDRLLVAHDEETGRMAGALFLVDMRFSLMDHWRTVKRVMLHPDFQGRGDGVALLAEAERHARAWGLAGLQLDLRGGLGLERFYERCGYKEVGRLPGALRVAPGDDRDSVFMWLDLR